MTAIWRLFYFFLCVVWDVERALASKFNPCEPLTDQRTAPYEVFSSQ